MKFEANINQEELERALVERIASSISWEVRKDIEKKVEKTLKDLDQATISRMVTEFLVAEHIGHMREKERL